MERVWDSELRILTLPLLCPPFGLAYVLCIFVRHLFNGKTGIIVAILQGCFEEKKYLAHGGASIAGIVINVVCSSP